MMAEDLMVRVPQVWTHIFFHLDGRSLHNCRQVSRGWNDFILSKVWGSQPGRRQMRRNLGLAWQHGLHQRSEKILVGQENIFQSELNDRYQFRMVRFSLENDKNWSEFDVVEHNNDIERCWSSQRFVIGLNKDSLVVWEKLTKRILFRKDFIQDSEYQAKFDSERCELVRALCNERTNTRTLQVEKFKVDDDGNVTETVHKIRMRGQKIVFKDYRSPYVLTLDIGKKVIGLCVFKLEGSDIEDIKTVETNLINRQRGQSYKNEALLNYPHVIVTSTYAKMLQVQLWNIETGQCIREFKKTCDYFGIITWLKMLDRKILFSMINYVLLVKCRTSVHVFDLDNMMSEDSIVTRELDLCSWAPWGNTDIFLNKTSTAIGTVYQKRKEENEFYFNYLSFWS